MENPIEESKAWFIECGYAADEAENLLRAIYDDDPDKLLEALPKWIEHVHGGGRKRSRQPRELRRSLGPQDRPPARTRQECRIAHPAHHDVHPPGA